jgi:tetratricopeptide (TPR) repeat protein
MEWTAEPGPRELEQMIFLAAQAAERNPERPEVWLLLADLHRLKEDHSQAEAVLARGVTVLPSDSELRAAFVEVRSQRGDIESAITEAGEAARLSPSNRAAQLVYFKLLLEHAEADQAAAMVPALKQLKIGDHSLLSFLLNKCRSHQDLSELRDYCGAVLSKDPGCTAAMYAKAVAMAKLGEVDSARAVLSLEDLVSVRELAAPVGYASEQLFHIELLAEIQQHPTLIRDPKGKSTRGGHQTAFLKRSDGPAINTLIEHIQYEVDRYVEALSEEASTFKLSRPQRATLSIWAVIYDEHGRQDSHFHPSGWLSGVYYPQIGKSDRSSRRGELLIGAVDPAEGFEPPWGIRAVEPKAGRLVLFPSYVPHATAPAGTGRVAVAFDVMQSTTF